LGGFDDVFRAPSFCAQIADAGIAVGFTQLLRRRLHQQRMMKKRGGLLSPEQAGQLDLAAGRIDQVLTADDEIHSLPPVIDDDRKLIRSVAMAVAEKYVSTFL
jgi:hypothetical protein